MTTAAPQGVLLAPAAKVAVQYGEVRKTFIWSPHLLVHMAALEAAREFGAADGRFHGLKPQTDWGLTLTVDGTMFNLKADVPLCEITPYAPVGVPFMLVRYV